MFLVAYTYPLPIDSMVSSEPVADGAFPSLSLQDKVISICECQFPQQRKGEDLADPIPPHVTQRKIAKVRHVESSAAMPPNQTHAIYQLGKVPNQTSSRISYISRFRQSNATLPTLKHCDLER